ncbi:MAG: hypothetical protein HY226_02125 [Candidatus Vogelbacteria bacterium]|nr:hypothetical protein [Candidatus Vogelbacteria bacterium]
MFKARFLLGVVMALSVVAYNYISGTNWSADAKTLAHFLDGVLYAAACIAMTISFVTLNDKGEIPIGSLTYRYMSWINGGYVPKQIKLCPAFWWIVGNLLAVSTAIGVAALFITVAIPTFLKMIVAFLTYLFTQPATAALFAGQLVLGTSAVAVSFYGLITLCGYFGAKEPIPAAMSSVICVGVSTFGTASLLDYCALHHVSILQAIWAGVLGFIHTGIPVIGAALGILCGLAAAVCAFVYSWDYSYNNLLPVARESFIGQFASAALGTLCPVIQIEQRSNS